MALLRGGFFAIFGLLSVLSSGMAQQGDDSDAPPTTGTARTLNSKTLFSPHSDAQGDRQFAAFFEGALPASGPDFIHGVRFSGAGLPKALVGRNHDIWFQPHPTRNVVFAGFDTTERDRYFSAGFKRAVGGDLEQPGFRFMATSGAKIRDYDPGLGIRENRLHAIRVLGGHEWQLASLTVGVLAGGSFTLNSSDTTMKTRSAGRFGATGIIELWQDWGRPGGNGGSRNTSLFAMVDQASRSSHVRLRHGFQLMDAIWRLGPELAYSTGESQSRRGVLLQGGWRKARLGAHLSEIPLRTVRLALSAGMEWRNARKQGTYMQLSAYLKY